MIVVYYIALVAFGASFVLWIYNSTGKVQPWIPGILMAIGGLLLTAPAVIGH